MAQPNKSSVQIETLFKMSVPLYCPCEDAEGNLYAVSTNGEVYQANDTQMEVAFLTHGQPTAMVFDAQGSSFVAD
jgi:hypothetical protein